MSDFLENYKKTHTHPVNKALHLIGIPSVVVAILFLIFTGIWQDWRHWRWGLSLFVFGWILQIVGHIFEGKAPAFLSNPIYLLIGPFWWIKKVMKGTKDKCLNSSKNSRDKI